MDFSFSPGLPARCVTGPGSAHEIATDYARRRQAFGWQLGEHEVVGFMLADNDMDLQTARLHIWHTAWLLDQGHKANFESSRAKVMCSEAEWRVVDRCAQILGGQGVTAETIVMRLFMDMRAFRIYDGPSEVHRWSMARKDHGSATSHAGDGIDRRALAALMRAHGLSATYALEIDRLTGGQSNPTFRVTAGSARYVLRKQPPGHLLPSSHAIDREYRVSGSAARDGGSGAAGAPVLRRHWHRRHAVLSDGVSRRPGPARPRTARSETQSFIK